MAWNRRMFLAAVTAVTGTAMACCQTMLRSLSEKRDVYIVPNFHPASCGWLTTFSKERSYCANSYLNHLDRVREDSNYEFVLSEINNIIAIMNFQPGRIPELKRRIAEGRVELVNGFFLESTVNLSGGEALVRLGVLGGKWYRKMYGTAPRYAWIIDTCGVHEQMPQIASGLGLEAMVYTRKNPTGKSLYWSVSPDGSKMLTLCPGHYAEASDIFTTKAPLNIEQLKGLENTFEKKEAITPEGLPVLILGGGDDYALAPNVKKYPSEFLEQWSAIEPARKLSFTTLSKYIDRIRPAIDGGHVSLPVFQGGTAYDFDAFWIENQNVKERFRHDEHALQAAEALATIASLTSKFAYPAQDLNDAWIMMCLSMDRNTLWGSAGGMVFDSAQSWDVQDRLAWVKKVASETCASAASCILPAGGDLALFNSLNWKRNDPIRLSLPPETSLHGVPCESVEDGSVLCEIEMSSMSFGAWALTNRPPTQAVPADAAETIETSHYVVKMDPTTGGIASLRLKSTGRELFSSPANQIVAERPKHKLDDPSDEMPPIPQQERLGTSADASSSIEVFKGPITTTIQIQGKFYGGGALRRTIRLFNHHPRIEFETEMIDVPNYTVVYAEFPLSEDIVEVRRGIPYGFSHGAWARTDPNLHGWVKGIVPAVRWIDYSLSGGGGVALLDRGLAGRELNGRTAAIYLINAEDKYWGYANSWLSGKGPHRMQYALLPRSTNWQEAAIPQAAWEYNCEPVQTAQRLATPSKSFIITSPNIIVEAMRREGNHIEVRLVECLGAQGQAEVQLLLPHNKLTFSDMAGRAKSRAKIAPRYSFAVRPQEIVTLHFETSSNVPEPAPVTKWDKFVPEDKLPALHIYDPNLIGHPPLGE